MRFREVSLILCLILDLNKMKHQISYDLAKKKEMIQKEWPLNYFLLFLCSYFISFFYSTLCFLISSVMKMDGWLLFILETKLNFAVAKKLPSGECLGFLLTWVLDFCIFFPQTKAKPRSSSSAFLGWLHCAYVNWSLQLLQFFLLLLTGPCVPALQVSQVMHGS